MAKITRSVTINATPEQIDDIATLSPDRLPEWFAGIESVEHDGTFPQPGATLKAVYKASGMSFNVTMTSLQYDRGTVFAQRMEGMVTGTQTWTLSPEGEATTLTVEFDYDMPGGGLGKLADKLVVERVNASNLEKSLEDLKQLIEGEV